MEDKVPFDRVVSTVDMMPILTKAARYLGPKGLMPNLKSGTLNSDILAALKNIGHAVSYTIDKKSSVICLPVALLASPLTHISENVLSTIDQMAAISKGTKTGKTKPYLLLS
jgi:large subunit ribosomal protein L1